MMTCEVCNNHPGKRVEVEKESGRSVWLVVCAWCAFPLGMTKEVMSR